MTQQDKTLLVFIVDRSGSMRSIAEDMVGGFKQLIAEQKKQPGECLVTITRFDDTYEVVAEMKPIAEITDADLELSPRGGTALRDALCRTILVTGEKLGGMPEEKRPARVLVTVITDGQENQSREFSEEQVRAMVKEQTEKYSWDFTFLGANQNAALSAQHYGFSPVNAVTYDADKQGASAVVQSFSNQVSKYRGMEHASRGDALKDLQLAYNSTRGESASHVAKPDSDKSSHAVSPKDKA